MHWDAAMWMAEHMHALWCVYIDSGFIEFFPTSVCRYMQLKHEGGAYHKESNFVPATEIDILFIWAIEKK